MAELQGMQLFNRIAENIKSLDILIAGDCWYDAAFMTQQVYEKCFKLMLYHSGVMPPIRIHDLRTLSVMFGKVYMYTDSDLYTFSSIVTTWEASARYDDVFIPNKQIIKDAVRVIKKFYKWIKNNYTFH